MHVPADNAHTHPLSHHDWRHFLADAITGTRNDKAANDERRTFWAYTAANEFAY